MWMQNDYLGEAAGLLRELEQKQLAAASLVRLKAEGSADSLLEKRFFSSFTCGPFSGKIAAVDGGIVAEEMQGVDLLLYRAAGACFEYAQGKLIGSKYFPSKIVPPQMLVNYSFDSFEVSWLKSIRRLGSELDCAIGLCRKLSPRFILLDGSIVPQTSDRPPKESKVFAEYELLAGKFRQLFEESEKQGIVLAGVIKDSRARHFLEILGQAIPEFGPLLGKQFDRTNDSLFLYSLLREGERSAFFQYSAQPGSHSVLRDLGSWAERVQSFYLKPVAFDRPLRVDFLSPSASLKKEFAEKIVSTIAGLSSANKAYAYPAVLIEADLCAAMDPRELDASTERLRSSLGPLAGTLFKLRRNSRPFR